MKLTKYCIAPFSFFNVQAAMEIPRPSHHNGRGLRRDLSFERRLDSKDQEKNYKKCMDAYKACTSTDTVIQCYENIRVCQEK